jgi:hypothetical protein
MIFHEPWVVVLRLVQRHSGPPPAPTSENHRIAQHGKHNLIQWACKAHNMCEHDESWAHTSRLNRMQAHERHFPITAVYKMNPSPSDFFRLQAMATAEIYIAG